MKNHDIIIAIYSHTARLWALLDEETVKQALPICDDSVYM